MGENFRSQEMTRIRIIFPIESIKESILILSKMGIIQFDNLNNDNLLINRSYFNELKEYFEDERRLNFIIKFLKMSGNHRKNILENSILKEEEEKKESISLETISSSSFSYSSSEEEEEEIEEEESHDYLNLSIHLEEKEEEINELLKGYEEIKKELTKIREMYLIKKNIEVEVGETENQKLEEIETINGIIEREKYLTFLRLIFRKSRGLAYFNKIEFKKKLKWDSSHLIGFSILYTSELIKKDILKLSEVYGARIFDNNFSNIKKIKEKVKELEIVNKRIENQIKQLRTEISSKIIDWIKEIKYGILRTKELMKLEQTEGGHSLNGIGWCPTLKIKKIKKKLSKLKNPILVEELTLSHNTIIPTKFNLSKFEKPFQEIIDSYGIAEYKEINPTPFTIITFPFLFSLMFGDIGHGLLLTLFSIYSFTLKKYKKNEIVKMIFKARFLIFLMGIFSIIIGSLYNEIFGIPINFGSCVLKDCIYKWGIDPLWMHSKNELVYMNSLKMKLSVLFGVLQMLLGLFLNLKNLKFFNLNLNIFCEWLPQLFHFLSIYGYMCFLIIYKWLNPKDIMIITTLIKMVLTPSDTSKTNLFFKNQDILQIILLIIFFITIPWMLFLKPFILRKRRRKRLLKKEDDSKVEEDEDEFNFSQIFINQLIHTIEFVLGCISNTASYLRLWALSLAHSQLSKVFWEMIFLSVLKLNIPGLSFISFIIFAFATITVLLIMEGLSAFLHTLRLHWVEFQGKFYKCDKSIKFIPINFNKEIDLEIENLLF